MIIPIIQILAFQLLLLIVALIECTISVPFVTVVIFLLQSRSFSTAIFFVYVSIVSLLIAVIMIQSWLLIFLVLVVGGIGVRANIWSVQSSFQKMLLLVGLMAVLISVFAQPTVSATFVFHSLLSLLVAAIICRRWFSFKEKKLRWKDVRFGGTQ